MFKEKDSTWPGASVSRNVGLMSFNYSHVCDFDDF